MAKPADDSAYSVIRELIAGGIYNAGRPLREEKLAASANFCRAPVPEALRRLDAERLVDLLPDRGPRVAEWSEQDVDEIFDRRVRLEGHGARLAAAHATEIQRAELPSWCERMEADIESRYIGRVGEASNAFHSGFLIAAGNQRLESAR